MRWRNAHKPVDSDIAMGGGEEPAARKKGAGACERVVGRGERDEEGHGVFGRADPAHETGRISAG